MLPIFSACAAAVGLTTVAPAPCVYDTMSLGAPVSCECLLECEAIGLMGVRECYVMDKANKTVAAWVQHQVHVRGLAPNFEYWDASLKLAHQSSVAQCNGHGVYAPRMPASGAPPLVRRMVDGELRHEALPEGANPDVLLVLSGEEDGNGLHEVVQANGDSYRVPPNTLFTLRREKLAQ